MALSAAGKNTGHADDHGRDQEDEPEDDDHDALRRFTLLPAVNAAKRVLSTSLTYTVDIG